ncbi:hypothetical protein UFOVP399_38 [uncultured Caudovirales phage]|uniref:Uncharacterized protein n=1 Tax=uncultured Caudovirales phage TaxID=2100421 RepID=A0A6J5M2H5_9CAUD|nr:hypothetical protein UFOVP399_38 [uncultured Caudovirales phage]
MTTKPAVQSLPREQAPAQYQEQNERRYRNQVDEELQFKHDKRSNLVLGRGKSLVLSSPSGISFGLGLTDAGILTVTDQETGATADITLDWTDINGRPTNLAALVGTEGINNALVPVGSNLLFDTSFLVLSTYWFGQISGGTIAYSSTQTRRVHYRQALFSGTPASGQWAALLSDSANRLPCTVGQKLALSGLIGAFRMSSIELRALWYDNTGANFSDTLIQTVNTPALQGGGDLSSYAELKGIVTVPSGAVRVGIWARGYTDGGASPHLRLARPLIALVTASQTEVPAWSPGSDSEIGANITATNTAAGFVGQGALATLSTAGTSQIAANAISNIVGSSTDGSITLTKDTWTTVASVAITTTGGKVLIIGNVATIVTTAGLTSPTVNARLLRDSTEIRPSHLAHYYAFDGGSGMLAGGSYCTMELDEPAAGTYTYKLDVRPTCVSGALTGSSNTRSIIATELKR